MVYICTLGQFIKGYELNKLYKKSVCGGVLKKRRIYPKIERKEKNKRTIIGSKS